MRLNLLIADFAYVGKQRVCLFDGPVNIDQGEGRGLVGRDPANCRMLIEGDNSVSRQHFEILYSEGRFWLRNLSRYGTRILGKKDLNDLGEKVVLENNDRIQIGETELLVTILPGGAGTSPSSPVRVRSGAASMPETPPSPNITNRDAEMEALRALVSSGMPARNMGTVPHVSGTDAMDAAPELPVQLPKTPRSNFSKHQIPEDLDLELLLGLPAVELPEKAIAKGAMGKRRSATRVVPERGREVEMPVSEAQLPVSRSGPASSAMVAEILIGAGVAPERAMQLQEKISARALGELIAALVGAISMQLNVCDNFKRNFRLASTEVKTSGNNPLKLAATPAEVLSEILDPPTGFLAMTDAVRDGALELQVHQVAVAECIRASFESLVDFLDPAKIEVDGDRAGRSLLSHISGGRDAASWKSYREVYERNFGDRHRAFLTIYLQRFGHDYESVTNRVKSSAQSKAHERKKGK